MPMYQMLHEYATMELFEQAQLAGEVEASHLNFIRDVRAICLNGEYYALPGTGSNLPIAGVVNISASGTAGQVYSTLTDDGQARLYLIGDSTGAYPSQDMAVDVSAAVMKEWAAWSPKASFNALLAQYITAQAQSFNVGDVLCVARMRVSADTIAAAYSLSTAQKTALRLLGSSFSVCQYRLIACYDSKAPGRNGATYGTMGLLTPADKQALADALPAARQLPSLEGSNMNSCLSTGVYPWCTLGRPTGSTGAYTLVTERTTTTDGAGYHTIRQTCYGRQGEKGQVYTRLIFLKADGTDTQYMDWIRLA